MSQSHVTEKGTDVILVKPAMVLARTHSRHPMGSFFIEEADTFPVHKKSSRNYCQMDERIN